MIQSPISAYKLGFAWGIYTIWRDQLHGVYESEASPYSAIHQGAQEHPQPPLFQNGATRMKFTNATRVAFAAPTWNRVPCPMILGHLTSERQV